MKIKLEVVVLLGLLLLTGCTMPVSQPSEVLSTAVAVSQGRATLEDLKVVAEVEGDMRRPPPSSAALCAIDQNKNLVIEDEELLAAIAAWIEGTPIDGEQIDEADMLDALAAWVLGTELNCPALRKGTGTQVKVYWTKSSYHYGTKIRRANPDGSSRETLVNCQDFPGRIALDLDGGKMYWIEYTKIWRANLDGTQAETIVTGLDSPEGIEVGGGKIYWTDSFKIQRARLDGSRVRDLITSGSPTPRGLPLI